MKAFPPALAAVMVAVALTGCGDTLVDHRNVGIQDGGGGSVCIGGQISCQVEPSPADPACVPEDELHCGACVDCTVGFAPPHSAAVPSCSVPGAAGSGVCDYRCTGGLLKCPSGGGCCAATAVAAGVAHSCAITSDGALACWGANDQGQVTDSPSASPVALPSRRITSGVVAVAAGEAHTCAALAGEIRCWGRNDELQAPDAVAVAGATALAAGLTHTCALAGGNVHCWGRGQAVATVVAGVAGATAIAAGTDHTCALVAGGVKCWGANASGQLGNNSTQPSTAPVDAQGLGSGIFAIAAGGDHTCAAAQTPVQVAPGVEDGVRCWGDAPGGSFLLPPPQTTPGIPMKDSNTSVIRFEVTALATSRSNVCVQRIAAEAIRCFGPANEAGQLGGTPTAPTELNDVPGSPGATAFAAGGDHACAAFADGGVRCWGSNAQAQLGDGSTITPGSPGDPRTLGSPVQVSGR